MKKIFFFLRAYYMRNLLNFTMFFGGAISAIGNSSVSVFSAEFGVPVLILRSSNPRNWSGPRWCRRLSTKGWASLAKRRHDRTDRWASWAMASHPSTSYQTSGGKWLGNKTNNNYRCAKICGPIEKKLWLKNISSIKRKLERPPPKKIWKKARPHTGHPGQFTLENVFLSLSCFFIF